MEQELFETWTLDRLEREARSFFERTKKYNPNTSKHDFKVLFRMYLVEQMLHGYIEDGKVHFRGIPEETMFEEVVEKIWEVK